jgi:hypothetical protein
VMTDAYHHGLRVAANAMQKSGIASLLCALLLAGCASHGAIGQAPALADPANAASKTTRVSP